MCTFYLVEKALILPAFMLCKMYIREPSFKSSGLSYLHVDSHSTIFFPIAQE